MYKVEMMAQPGVMVAKTNAIDKNVSASVRVDAACCFGFRRLDPRPPGIVWMWLRSPHPAEQVTE
jgi:hypothetical protein